jgi:hypothetical protein
LRRYARAHPDRAREIRHPVAWPHPRWVGATPGTGAGRDRSRAPMLVASTVASRRRRGPWLCGPGFGRVCLYRRERCGGYTAGFGTGNVKGVGGRDLTRPLAFPVRSGRSFGTPTSLFPALGGGFPLLTSLGPLDAFWELALPRAPIPFLVCLHAAAGLLLIVSITSFVIWEIWSMLNTSLNLARFARTLADVPLRASRRR